MLNKEEIVDWLQAARAETFKLYDWVLDEEDLRHSPRPGFRPLLWHLGHVGAFEEWWILQAKGDSPLAPHYQVIFDPIKTPREEANRLPPRSEIEKYLARVRQGVIGYLLGAKDGELHPLLENGYFFHLVLEHEYQHQETIAYLLQMLDPQRKKKPAQAEAALLPVAGRRAAPGEMVKVPGGPFIIGSRGYPFAYDNEQPPQEVELEDFRIDRCPVTNVEFADFVEAGGYSTRALWSDAGWAWREENEITHPLYWSTQPPRETQEMFETGAMRPDFPVTGVSWHEAQAYARFVGKSLPTEAEWEKAASWDGEANRKLRFPWGERAPAPELGNFGGHYLGPTPVGIFARGQSAYGCLDMAGNVWEWTATTFEGYPGFEAFPYPEYSAIWFDGDHRVLKGGSWMTRAPLLRCSFRNFFRQNFRYAFAGFRCRAS